MPVRDDQEDRAGATPALVDALAQTAFATMGELTRIASGKDLSLTQLRVLAILRDRRLRMSDLVGHLGLEKSTLTGLVSRAETRGLVVRAANPEDKRAVDVMLTDEGQELAGLLATNVADRLKPRLSKLNAAEQDTLEQLLVKAFT